MLKPFIQVNLSLERKVFFFLIFNQQISFDTLEVLRSYCIINKFSIANSSQT